MVVDRIAFGFSIQYTDGPQFGRDVPYDNPSVQAFHSHINEYVRTELAHSAMEGPFMAPPFTPGLLSALS